MDLMHTIAWQIQYDLLLAIPWGEKEHTHTHLQPVMWQLHLSPKTLKINVYVYTPSSNHLCSGKKNKVEPKELLHQHLINYKDTRQNMRQMDVHSTSFNHL